jgi:acetyl-CoA carboxylase beta subunit
MNFMFARYFNKQTYCSKCLPNFKERYSLLKDKASKKAKEKQEEKKKVQEYKRKCNQCGKVWHSLVADEKSLNRGAFLESLVAVGTALSGDLGTSAQSRRNAQAQQGQDKSLKRCPKCGSADYTEELVSIKKK